MLTTTDNVSVDEHAVSRRRERFAVDEDPADMWRGAVPVENYERAPRLSAMYARVHPDHCAVMLARRDVLVTMFPLRWEPAHVVRELCAQVPGITPGQVRSRTDPIRLDADQSAPEVAP